MRRSVLALAILGALVAPLSATTVVPMSFTELVTEASAIVYARVTDVQGHWTDDRHAIESVVSVDVMTAFKGTPGPTMTFTVPGGQAGRFQNLIPGLPNFSRGDLIVVFLTARGARLPGPTGLSQGVFRVTLDASTGSMRVMPPALTAGTRIVRGDPRRQPLPLAAFGDAVRAVSESRR